MLNNLFVNFENVETLYPVSDLEDINDNLFNLYSDEMLEIPADKTSFAPKLNIYDSLLNNLKQPTTLNITLSSAQNITLSSVQSTTLNTGDKRSYAKNWLIQNKGLNNEQASALVGVWWAESKLNPSIHEIGKENNPNAGKGIAQWTGRLRLKHAEDIYKRIFGKSKQIKEMTLEEQMEVAIAEFKERGTWNNFVNSNDLKTATDIVWRGYENGYNTLATHEQMKKTYGSKAYNKQWLDRFRFASEISKL